MDVVLYQYEVEDQGTLAYIDNVYVNVRKV